MIAMKKRIKVSINVSFIQNVLLCEHFRGLELAKRQELTTLKNIFFKIVSKTLRN